MCPPEGVCRFRSLVVVYSGTRRHVIDGFERLRFGTTDATLPRGALFTEAERAFNLVLARALEAEGHDVYLPQRDTRPAEGAERTKTIFHTNLAALAKAEAVVAVCDGPQVDDGTAWEIGYAYARNIQIYGLRTDSRIVQQPDERINLMILESLSELFSTIEQLLHTLRYAQRP